MTQNSFLSDKSALNLTPEQKAALLDQLLKEQPIGKEIDLNKPVHVSPPPGGWPKYPKLVYHANGLMLTVKNEKEEKAALKHGYQLDPVKELDYGRIVGGRAQAKQAAPPKEEVPSAEQLAELDEE